jgi:hypothetical protein
LNSVAEAEFEFRRVWLRLLCSNASCPCPTGEDDEEEKKDESSD